MSKDRSRAVYYCRCGMLLTLCTFDEITDSFDDDNDDDLMLGQEQPNMEDYQTEPAVQQIKHFSHDQHFFILSDAVVRDLDVVAPNKNNTYRFNLHQICAHLPLTMLPPLHRRHLTLLSAAPSFDSV
ncbi:hypothetical protein ACFX1W_014142 [Malus domestica]